MLTALSISWLTFLKTDTYVCFQHLAFLSFNCPFGNAFLFITSGEVTLQVSLLTENGNTKDDLKLPNDENLQAQVSALPQAGQSTTGVLCCQQVRPCGVRWPASRSSARRTHEGRATLQRLKWIRWERHIARLRPNWSFSHRHKHFSTLQ
jgi:hypothetical protein